MIQVNDILERFRALRDFDGFGHVLLLVDPLSGHVPLENWTPRVQADNQWALRDPQVRDVRFPFPRLLLIGEADDALLEESIRIAGAADNVDSVVSVNPAICGWLFAHGITSDVRRHLIAAAQQRNAKYEPVRLRYYDPRVLPYLNQMLEPEQRQQLLGPVAHWFALDRFGRAVDLQTQPPAPYIPSSLSLTADQWASIERIEAVNRTLAAYSDLTGEPLPVDRETELNIALERAAMNGMSALDDAMTFALYALSVRPDFDLHPAVAEALKNVRTSRLALVDELSLLPAHVWTELKNVELKTPPK